MNVILDDINQHMFKRSLFVLFVMFATVICILGPCLIEIFIGINRIVYNNLFLFLYFAWVMFLFFFFLNIDGHISEIVDKRLELNSVVELEKHTQIGKDLLPILSIMFTIAPYILAGVFKWHVMYLDIEKMFYGAYKSVWENGVLPLTTFIYGSCVFVFILSFVIPNYKYYSIMTVNLKQLREFKVSSK